MDGRSNCRFGFGFGDGKIAKAEITRRRNEIKTIGEEIKKNDSQD
jgi:hypothetical protein